MLDSVAKPVQQINNPIKAPVWKTTSLQFMHETWNALEEFCKENDYSKRELVDVAIREYLKMPEPKDHL